MANAIYPKYKQSLLAGDANTDLDTNTVQDGVYAILVDTADEAYNAADQFYSDLTGAGLIGTEQRIANPTVALGLFDGDNVTFTGVTGDSAEAIILFRKNSGANTTWRLIAFLDTGVTGLPVTPNGGDIGITWHASGIFQL